ncbi:MAG: DinB family protein [Acidobacteriia bacterium]|nr:DinB family protein [Terriglobia bacterium]
MDADERSGYLETVKETPKRLQEAVKGVPKKILMWSPAPGKWSIVEIVCHMRDMERDAYLKRYQRMLSEENPSLKDIDGDYYALERSYRKDKLSAALKEWKDLRREVLRLLKNVKQDQWQRGGVHEIDGPLTVETLLRRQAKGNDEAHLGQIEDIKKRYALLQSLEDGLRAVEAAVKGASDEIVRRRAEPNKWSILEIVSHLATIEQIFLTRYSQMAFRDRPTIFSFDNNALAASLRFNERDLGETLKEFKRLRQDTLTLLRALPSASWQRTGIHPKRGEISIASVVENHSHHDSHHAERILNLRKELP